VINTEATIYSPSIRRVLTALFQADLIVLVKNRLNLVMSFLLPVLMLYLTNSEKAAKSFGGSEFVIGLCIAVGLISTSIMGYAVSVARDREIGVFQRLRVTPAATWTIMVSRLAIRVMFNLVIAAVVLFIGARMHHLSLSVEQYGLVLAISILGGAVFLSIGQALAGLVKSSDAVNSTGRLLYIFLVLFSVLGLNGSLGSSIETLARWLPVGTVMTLFAGVLHLAAWGTRDTQSLAACAGYIVVCAVVGVRWFRWD